MEEKMFKVGDRVKVVDEEKARSTEADVHKGETGVVSGFGVDSLYVQIDGDTDFAPWAIPRDGLEILEDKVKPKEEKRSYVEQDKMLPLPLRLFWMIYVEGKTGSTYKHFNRMDALKEAERLARLRNKRVYVLLVQSYCEVDESPVKWTHL